LEDRVETFFIRLSSGSGIDGLASIEEFRPYSEKLVIVRPLLNFCKDQIKATCQYYSQPWIEDPSNETDAYFRNRIRKILQVQVFPSISPIQWKSLMDDLYCAKYDYSKRCLSFFENYSRFDARFGYCSLRYSALQKLDEYLALRIFIRVIRMISGQRYSPSFRSLRALYQRFKYHTFERTIKETIGGVLFYLWRNNLIVMPEKKSKEQKPIAVLLDQPITWNNLTLIFSRTKKKDIPLDQSNNGDFLASLEGISPRKLFLRQITIEDWTNMIGKANDIQFLFRTIPWEVKLSVPVLVDDKRTLFGIPHFNYVIDPSYVCKIQSPNTFGLFSNLDEADMN